MNREEKKKFYRALIAPAYIEGAKTALKHWERWRMQPEKVLINHIKKLAEEAADKRMQEIEEASVKNIMENKNEKTK